MKQIINRGVKRGLFLSLNQLKPIKLNFTIPLLFKYN